MCSTIIYFEDLPGLKKDCVPKNCNFCKTRNNTNRTGSFGRPGKSVAATLGCLLGLGNHCPAKNGPDRKIFMFLPVLDSLLVGMCFRGSDVTFPYPHTQAKIAVRLFDEEMAASVKKVPTVPAITEEMEKLQVGKGVLKEWESNWLLLLLFFCRKES